MIKLGLRRSIPPFVIVLAWALVASSAAAQNTQQNAADADRVIKALDIRAGSVVGEVGAGDGALTVAIASAVGDGGRVFSNELNGERLAAIRSAAGKQG